MEHFSQAGLEQNTPSSNRAFTTLNPSSETLVVINTYQTRPERSEELYNALVSATNEVLRFLPGFVSANLHVSLDGRTLVNYAQWQSKGALEAAGQNSNVKERIGAVAAIVESFSPVLYELRACLPKASSGSGPL